MISFNCRVKRDRNEVLALNANKLKDKIVEKGLTISKVSELACINRTSLYRKLNNHGKFTINEASRIKEVLELSNSESIDIFLKV